LHKRIFRKPKIARFTCLAIKKPHLFTVGVNVGNMWEESY
jgi:hypothetical protein